MAASSTLAQQIARTLQNAGLSRAGAAGVLGNLQQESSINPNAPGGGLAQWIGSRQTALQKFAASQGKPATDPGAQTGFLLSELKTGYPSLYGSLKSATDPRAAALAFSQQFERPGVPMNQNRENYAASLYGQIGGGGPGLSTSPGAVSAGPSFTTTGPSTQFDQAAFDQAKRAALAGQFLAESAKTTNLLAAPGPKSSIPSGLSPIGPGLLTTKTPNAADFTTSTAAQTTQNTPVAHAALQDLAGGTALSTHPAVKAAADKVLTMAVSALGGPYSQAAHATAFTQSAAQLRKTGTDCSGFVSWLMGPDGLGIWKTALATPQISSAPGIQKGPGQAITIYNNPLPGNSGHVFIQIGNQFFQSAGGGTGISRISTAGAQSMIKNGDNGAPYYALHPQGY